MNFSTVTDRLAGLGGAKWRVHERAAEMAHAGCDVIRLTIGEPDIAAPPALIADAGAALAGGARPIPTGAARRGCARRWRRSTARGGAAISPPNR